MNYAKFAVFRDEQGCFYFRLYNARGKLLVTGLPYSERLDCISAVRQLYAHSGKDHFYRMRTSDYRFYFEIIDERHTVICTSILYRTMAGMAYGIKAVKDNATIAVIEDRTGVAVT